MRWPDNPVRVCHAYQASRGLSRALLLRPKRVDLDAALLAPDFPQIEAVLSANLLTRQANHDLRRWNLSCSFVFSILKNIVGSDSQDMAQRLRFMRQRFSQLSVRHRRQRRSHRSGGANLEAPPPLASRPRRPAVGPHPSAGADPMDLVQKPALQSALCEPCAGREMVAAAKCRRPSEIPQGLSA